jgi:hypothetical protein
VVKMVALQACATTASPANKSQHIAAQHALLASLDRKTKLAVATPIALVSSSARTTILPCWPRSKRFARHGLRIRNRSKPGRRPDHRPGIAGGAGMALDAVGVDRAQ